MHRLDRYNPLSTHPTETALVTTPQESQNGARRYIN
jgi:hypothetical protein